MSGHDPGSERPTAVFFGTPDHAVPVLEALARIARVALVVSQPDRPSGRGRRLTATPVRAAAERMGIEVVQPCKVRDPQFTQRLRSVGADFFLVIAYGRILPAQILSIPPRGCLNIHGSLLPRHRGAAPIQRAIMCGDEVTGLTLMLMDEGLDTGPIIDVERVEIGREDTAQDLTRRLCEAAPALMERAIPAWLQGRIGAAAQPGQGASMAPPLGKDEGRIDWGLPAAQIHRLVRGVTPWPGARTTVGGIEIRIAAVGLPGEPEGSGGTDDGRGPGDIRIDKGRMLVRCGDGWIEVVRLKAPGRNEVGAADFARGCRIAPLERFGS